MKLTNFFNPLTTIVAILIFAVGCGKPASPRENVETAIADAILMLESNKIEKLIKTYIPPNKLVKMLKKNDIKDLVSKNSAGKMRQLLMALKSAQLLEPQYSSDLKSAKFRTSPNELIMIKIDGYWYIK